MIGVRRRLFQDGVGGDHVARRQILADAEMLERTLGLRAPKPVGGDTDLAEGVGFYAKIAHLQLLNDGGAHRRIVSGHGNRAAKCPGRLRKFGTQTGSRYTALVSPAVPAKPSFLCEKFIQFRRLERKTTAAHVMRGRSIDNAMTETVAEILDAYRRGTLKPADIVARSFARIRRHDDPAIFIALRGEADVVAEAKALARDGDMALPLYGIPVAVKDNIDVKGLPTTAACPAFGYRPGKDATSVAKLRQAGALILGKTNLDQFATGLVGVRTPYGIARNLFDDKLIAGGSSTGSALAVAAGFTPLALGTDTAGSGRVPAAFGNIVGLKPSRGMVSCAGVVPACRTLDCVSVFALTVDDAMAMLNVIAGPDAADPYSHPRPVGAVGPMPDGVKLGVPLPGQRLFFGDTLSTARPTTKRWRG